MTKVPSTNELSLLDLAVTVAENWVLLVFVPLMAGALVYFVTTQTSPRFYKSDAIIRISSDEALLLLSDEVLNDVVAAENFGTSEDVRNALDVSEHSTSDYYVVSATQTSAEAAQKLVMDVIDSLISKSGPDDSELQRIERAMSRVTAEVNRLEPLVQQISQDAVEQDLGASSDNAMVWSALVALESRLDEQRRELERLEDETRSSVSFDDYVQQASLPASANSTGALSRAILAVLGTGFFVLIAVFVREGLRNSIKQPDDVKKLNRIRRAFWLPPL